MRFPKQSSLRRGPAFGQAVKFLCNGILVQIDEYLVDHHRVLDTGDYLDGAAAFAANTSLLERPLVAAISTGRCNTLPETHNMT